MKKIIFAYGLLVLVVILLAFAKFRGYDFLPKFGAQATATINNREFKIIIADDEKERQVGLSNRRTLDKNSGMLFIFPKKGIYSFWMKNTLIPLDMIFINDNKIVHIVKKAVIDPKNNSPLPIYTPPTEANYVLEINSGQAEENKIKNGDLIILKGVK